MHTIKNIISIVEQFMFSIWFIVLADNIFMHKYVSSLFLFNSVVSPTCFLVLNMMTRSARSADLVG